MFDANVSPKRFCNDRRLTNLRNSVARRDVYHRRLTCEPLEDRRMLSVFTVMGTGDESLSSVPGGMFGNPVPGQADTFTLPSLRAAVEATNGHSGSDTIQFDASLAGETIVLENGQLTFLDQTGITTINGLGADQLAVSGNSRSQVFRMRNADADISGLTICDAQGTSYFGGGIDNWYASLSITDCVISNNSAQNRGGGICNYGTLTVSGTTFSGNYGELLGGGIYSDGTATISNCVFSGNSADWDGGGIDAIGTLTVTNTTFSNNSADIDGRGDGGGIYNYGSATLANNTFSHNSGRQGGGICNGGEATLSVTDCSFSDNEALSGGGIMNFGTMNISGSDFSNNLADYGGGIDNIGPLTISNSSFLNNIAQNWGGGIRSGSCDLLVVNSTTFSGNTAGECGGGIVSFSSLNLLDCTFSQNSAVQGGGVYLSSDDATVMIGGSVISDNSADETGGGICGYGLGVKLFITDSNISDNSASNGGGIYNNTYNMLRVTGSTLAGNQAVNDGGGISCGGTVDITDSTFVGNSAGRGGGIANYDALTVANSTFSDNSANQGGGIYINGLDDGNTVIITGSTISGNSADNWGGGIWIGGSSASLTVTDSTISGNSSPEGGGIANLTWSLLILQNVVISGNSAASHYGGGIDNYGTLYITNSTLDGNTAADQGGGIYNHGSSALIGCTLRENSAGNSGGGIFNYSDSTLTIDSSTLSENSSDVGGGITNYATLSITSSTFSGNSADSLGGGIYNDGSPGTLTVFGSTLVGNSAKSHGGGICTLSVATLNNTILAGNASDASLFVDLYSDTSLTANHCLIQNPETNGTIFGSGNLFDVDPLLGTLGDYGGPTQTIPLLPGSPAINTGDNTLVPSGVTTDQRGFGRIVGSAVDIGAFESRGFTLSVAAGDNQTTLLNRAFAVPLAVRVVSSFDEPVAGGKVRFTAPGSGASAAFSAENSSIVEIDDQGLAQASATANATEGSYTVNAVATGSSSEATFNLTNVAPPKLSIADATLTEGDRGTKKFAFNVNISGLNPLGASVSYIAEEGTATASSDYGSASGTLIWDAGDTSPKTISIAVNGDTNVEADETFYVNLSSPTNATVSKSQAMGTIVNDDIALTIVATDAVKSEGNSGATPFTFTISRTGLTTGTTTVNYAVAGSGAHPVNAADFGGALPRGMVLFAAGETSKTLTIDVRGDLGLELDEDFVVTISGASDNSQIIVPTAKGVILNDDVNQPPTKILLSSVMVDEDKPSGTAVGTFSTIDPDDGNTFTYSLVSGEGSDDNNQFAISGDTLETVAAFDHETKSSYNIRVRSTDQDGLWTEETLAIGVANVNEVSPATWQDTIGLFAPTSAMFYLRNSNDIGFADLTFAYGPGNAGWTPIAGDWDDDANSMGSVGLYNPTTSIFYLRNTNDTGFADLTFQYGPANAGWLPIAGDWDADGTDTIGLYDSTTSVFYLRNSNDAGFAESTFSYGPANAGWLPIAGDWNGDGIDTIGLYNPTASTFYLRNTNEVGFADSTFAYGPANAGWTPIAGDWNVDGTDTIGLYSPTSSVFYLKNANEVGFADTTFAYGPANAGWTPIVSDWNGSASLLVAADGESVAPSGLAPLTEPALAPLVGEAIARWNAAGLSATLLSELSRAKVAVADLPDAQLGMANGDTVYIDRDAAGHGWFVDPSPTLDEEFLLSANGNQLQAVDSRAVDRIDLLSVVEHELGHIAGLDDLDADTNDLMSGVLEVSLRRSLCHAV